MAEKSKPGCTRIFIKPRNVMIILFDTPYSLKWLGHPGGSADCGSCPHNILGSSLAQDLCRWVSNFHWNEWTAIFNTSFRVKHIHRIINLPSPPSFPSVVNMSIKEKKKTSHCWMKTSSILLWLTPFGWLVYFFDLVGEILNQSTQIWWLWDFGSLIRKQKKKIKEEVAKEYKL